MGLALVVVLSLGLALVVRRNLQNPQLFAVHLPSLEKASRTVSNCDRVATLSVSASSGCPASAILLERLRGFACSGLPLVLLKVSDSSDELMRTSTAL